MANARTLVLLLTFSRAVVPQSSNDCSPFLPPARDIICRENLISNHKGIVPLSVASNVRFKALMKNRQVGRIMSYLNSLKASAVVIDPGDATFPDDWIDVAPAFVHSRIRVIFVRNANLSTWEARGGSILSGTWQDDVSALNAAHRDKNATTDLVSDGRGKAMQQQIGALLVPIPIGLNFHTLMDPTKTGNRRRWGERAQSALSQFRTLCSVRRSSADAARNNTMLKTISSSSSSSSNGTGVATDAAGRHPRRGNGRRRRSLLHAPQLPQPPAPTTRSKHHRNSGGRNKVVVMEEEEVRRRQLRVLAPFRATPPGEDRLRDRWFDVLGWPTRWHIWRALNKTGRADMAVGIARRRMWELMGSYAIVASPPGHGLDCHRTWEALSMGCVVLVHASPLDPLFAFLELPVVPLARLEDWTALADPGRLQAIVDRYAAWTQPAHLVPRPSAGKLLDLRNYRRFLSTHQPPPSSP